MSKKLKPWQKFLINLYAPARWGLRIFKANKFRKKYRPIKTARLLRKLRKELKKLKETKDMKALIESKTFWGIVLMIYGYAAQFFGTPDVDSDAVSDIMVELSSYVAEVVGALLAFWGRLTATKKITGIVSAS